MQETFAGVEAELAETQTRRKDFETKERELQDLLDTHSREYDATATDFAEMEEMGRKKVRSSLCVCVGVIGLPSGPRT